MIRQTSRMRGRAPGQSIAGGVLLLFGLLGTVSAHHSFGMFDMAKTETLHGTVKELQWTNPHCFLQLLVAPDAGGKPIEWSIEMGSPLALYRQGVRPSALRAGDKATVRIHPVKHGSAGGSLESVTEVNGKKLTPGTHPSTAGPKP